MRYFLVHVIERAIASDGHKGGLLASNHHLAKAICEVRYNIRGTEKVIVSEVKSPEAKTQALQGHRFYLAEKAEFDAIMRNLK